MSVLQVSTDEQIFLPQDVRHPKEVSWALLCETHSTMSNYEFNCIISVLFPNA